MNSNKEIRVRNSPPFKLKDKLGRNIQPINLRKQFGFLPEIIIIEKIPQEHDTIFVRAVLTEEETKKEDERKQSKS
jgi:hypothetical protein